MKVGGGGRGIIGCATAYELAGAGCAVTLFERATLGAGASGAAAGMLAPIMARLMTELIVKGRASLPLGDFSPDRFLGLASRMS